MTATRGSINKGIANGIGASLVSQLGGSGYAPSEWDSKINLLGIADADIATALASITEATPSGEDRGSILLTKANSIGAMLNKKYKTSQGFKPNRWASAIDQLTPLPEKTASGSIAHITDGADEVPVKNWLVTLPASLSGYSEVNGYKQGANVIDYASNLTSGTSGGLTFSVTADGGISYSGTASSTFAYMTAKFDFAIKSGQTFTFSRNTAFNYIHRITLTFSDDTTANVSILANDTSVTYTPAKDVKAVRLLVAGLTTNTSYNDTVYLQTEYGSTSTAYEAYEAPTTYTASLGRTIYGGQADIVTGEGEETHGKKVFDGTEGTGGTPSWTMISVTQGTMFRITVSDKATTSATNTACSYYTPTAQAQRADGTVSGAGTNVDIIDNRFSSVDAFKAWLAENPVTLVYELATPTPFTFTPITADTELGTNNFWVEEGGSAVTYRADIDLAT